MVTGSGNPGGGRRTPDQFTPKISDKVNITTGQPPRDELGAGAINDGSKQTVKDLIDHEFLRRNELLPEWSKLCGLLIQLRDYLEGEAKVYFQFPDKENLANLKTNDGLETILRTAFEYIRLSEIYESSIPEPLAKFVVEIADELKAVVYKIRSSEEFSYEEKAEFLEGFISFMVNFISKIDPELRGIKLYMTTLEHPNHALLRALNSAAYALLNEAAKRAKELGNFQVLIDVINRLHVMIQSLRDDEEWPISKKINTIRGLVMEMVKKNRNIDDNLIGQIERIIGQDTEDSLKKLINW